MSSSASPWTAARLLTGLVLLTLAGYVLADTPNLASSQAIDSSAEFSPADEQGRFTYLVEFAQPSLVEQHQQRSNEKFDYNSPANQSARDQLMAIQAENVSLIGQTIGRSAQPSHHYLATRNGVAMRLTPDEASRVLTLPEVDAIQRERVYELNTFRGPEFIGAGSIWDGSAVPGGSPLLGELMVAAILDSGIPDPSGHPSFANDPSCGHGAGSVPDKVLSFLDCASTDASGLCNGPEPLDDIAVTGGHGSHTASTVAGNVVDNTASPSPDLPAPFTSVSGVAPCAHIRSYKVCPDSCPGADLAAGMESVLIHGDADVMNYSISGGTSPWNDFDRTKLDLVDAGVFVAASAGNTNATITDPVGQVNHRGPWVMTVAASTHDGLIGKSVSLDGGPTDLFAIEGTGPELAADFTGDLRYAGDVDAANVEGCDPFPANAFDGEAALISRGSCAFADKVNNAEAAGANFVIVHNNVAGLPIVMGGLEATTVSSVMVSLADGTALADALAGGTAQVTVPVADAGFLEPEAGDVLADFSFRGPTPSPLEDLQKPNITAPGVNILAGVPGGFGFLSGTSMSGPHVAGAGVLVRQANPDWSVSEVKSAIQMTASKDGRKDDGTTPWDWDDVGHGRVDLTGAALAGLVMDETTANYLAADPSTGGDVKTLNTPDVRNVDCTPDCSFQRTVRNTLDVASDWTVTVVNDNPDLDIQVSPTSFSFTGDTTETQTLSITVTPQANLTAGIEFGQILLTEDADQAPEAHLTTAISGTNLVPPSAAVDETELEILLEEDDAGSTTFNISNAGDPSQAEDLTYSIDEASPATVVLEATSREADPPQPITLAVDGHDGATSGVGLANQEFVWFNQLTPGPLDLPFDLEAVQILEFPSTNFNVQEGDVYDVHVWSDPDRNPLSGDEVLLSSVLGETVGASPAFVDIPLPAAVPIDESTGDVLIGLVNREARDPHFPSLSDSGVQSAQRSWIGFNFPGGVAGSPPDLSQAGTLALIDDLGLPRNWVIRGLGTGGSACLTPEDVPWLTVSPASGTIAGGSSEEITVSVDMTGLGQGTFEARVCVNTSDSLNPVFVLPLTVQVTGAGGLPTIDVVPASVDVGVDVLNPTASDSIDISNTGNDLDLEWSIGEAEVLGANPNFELSQSEKGGSGYALGTLDGARLIGADELSSLARTSSAGRDQQLISVDGKTTGGLYDSGDPDNSTQTFNIGEGNQIVGVGWEVNIATVGASWLSESSVAIVTNAGDETGLFLAPGAGDDGPGDSDYSSDGILLFEDAGIAPIVADAAGDVFLEWFDSFDDDPGVDSNWSDSSAPVTLPAGLTLLVEPAPTACDFPSDVSWVSVSPSSGTTAAGGMDTVAVDFDATDLAPGLYEAFLCIESNDPATPRIELPVSMDVTVPANAARIEGTVEGLGHCQASPAGAAGAGVEIVGGSETFNLTADANGFYGIFLDEANGPVDITASAPNHLSGSQTGVAIAGETTTTADFGLVLEAPCAEVAPGAFNEVFVPGETGGNFSMTIDNALGGDQLVWGIQEANPSGDDDTNGVEGRGDLACSNPADVPWLSVDPFFGAADAGDSSEVTISVDTTGLAPGSHEAVICVESNDDETGTIQAPFSIEVLGDAVFQDRFEG